MATKTKTTAKPKGRTAGKPSNGTTKKKTETPKEGTTVFHLLERYQMSTRIIKGYKRRNGTTAHWTDITLADGTSKLEEPPTFRNLRLIVQNENEELVNFLKESPECVGSPNFRRAIYRVVDTEKDLAEEMAFEEKVIDAKAMVKRLSDEQLTDLGYVLRRAGRTPSEVKQYAYKEIDELAEEGKLEQFLDYFDKDGNLNNYYQVEALVRKAVTPEYKVLIQKKDGIYFYDERVAAGGAGAVEKLVNHLTDPKNEGLLAQIEDELKTRMTS